MNWLKRCVIVSIAIVVCSAGGLSGQDISRVDSTYTSGLAYVKNGEYESAVRCFHAALKVDPKHAPTYVALGHVYLKKGDLKEAEKAFRQALRRQKDYPPALNGLGLVFRNTDKMLDWAIKYFRSACQADRRYVEAYLNLAEVYRELGDTRELDTYEKLVHMVPEHSDAWFQIGSAR